MEYTIAPSDRKLINIINEELGFNPAEITRNNLNEIREPLIKKSLSKKLIGAAPRHIESETFIIPVPDGAITGYLFRNRKRHTMSDLTPLVIFFHGGGWTLGNMELYNRFCARLSASIGAPVLSVDYRLAPQNKFPTAVEDCYASLLWSAAGCRYWKVDPDSIYLVGECAGGNLAAVVSRLARDRKGPEIAGQVLLSPITDGRMRTPSYEKFRNSPTLNTHQMAFFIEQYANEPKDILNPDFSPMQGIDQSRLPETLIIGAGIDPLRDDGLLYSKLLKEADTPVQFLEAPQSVHGFPLYPKLTGYDEAHCAIRQFITGNRNAGQVEWLSSKEYKRSIKRKQREIRKNRSRIEIKVN